MLSPKQRIARCIRQKAYRLKNWERVREVERKSHSKHAHKREVYRKSLWSKKPEAMRQYYRDYFSGNKKRRKEVQSKHYHRNRQSILAKGRDKYRASLQYQHSRAKAYHEKHKHKISAYHKQYRESRTPEQREAFRARMRRYKAIKRRDDPAFRLDNACRGKVHLALKRIGSQKSDRTIDLLGCTVKFLQDFLEHQFETEMTWDNYGTYWHVDHIIPVSSFDLLSLDERKKAFHYSNCRPMVATDNMKKGTKLPAPHQALLI